MPVYEYECPKCKEVKEILQTSFEIEENICDKCKVKMQKIMSQNSFYLKGRGWSRDTI